MRQDGKTETAAPTISGSADPASADSPEPVVDNRLFVLVLQHPQERSEERATAAATVAVLRRARLVVGLSWPNLTRALDRPTSRPVDPNRWGVLYLGSARPSRPSRPREQARPNGSPDGGPLDADAIIALGRDGNPSPEADRVLRGLEGIILLDGTWSQAKTLWWRNPWLLKLHRLVLNPSEPARFGQVRREPRREALSTLEATSLVLRRVEPGAEPADALLAALDRLIAGCGGRRGGPGAEASVGAAGPPPDRRSRYGRRPAPYRGRSATG